MSKTVTHDESGNASWGGDDFLQASQGRSFASMIFETLCGKTPSEAEARVFELILNLSIDHGPDTPSAKEVIAQANERKSISDAVAAGIMKIDDVHGGAQEQLMKLLYQVQSNEEKVMSLVESYLKEDKRIPGYGHRLYKDSDPRAQVILTALKGNGFSEEFINIAQELEKELEKQKGQKLPLNVDGAIAVALCTFGWEAKLGKAVFVIARTPGLCAHFLNANKA